MSDGDEEVRDGLREVLNKKCALLFIGWRGRLYPAFLVPNDCYEVFAEEGRNGREGKTSMTEWLDFCLLVPG